MNKLMFYLSGAFAGSIWTALFLFLNYGEFNLWHVVYLAIGGLIGFILFIKSSPFASVREGVK